MRKMKQGKRPMKSAIAVLAVVCTTLSSACITARWEDQVVSGGRTWITFDVRHDGGASASATPVKFGVGQGYPAVNVAALLVNKWNLSEDHRNHCKAERKDDKVVFGCGDCCNHEMFVREFDEKKNPLDEEKRITKDGVKLSCGLTVRRE